MLSREQLLNAVDEYKRKNKSLLDQGLIDQIKFNVILRVIDMWERKYIDIITDYEMATGLSNKINEALGVELARAAE